MRAWIVVLSVLGFLTGADSAKADRRIALVVGNSAYKNMPPLANAAGDAMAMAKLLREADFEVVEGFDATHEQITAQLLEFGKKAEGADLALFYYSGQGIAVKGVSYLLPVDADIKPGMDVGLGRGIELDAVLDQTIGGAAVRLVFLDASRDNPLKNVAAGTASKPVAPMASATQAKTPGGTLIGYATGPGQTASDGTKGGHRPYTKALLDNISKPGVELQEAMRMVRAQVNSETNKTQLPWGNSDLQGEIYLNPAAVSPGASKK
jgi:uncharacterized caspase-like protein